MKVRAFGLSDVGRCREINQDELLVHPELGLYAVADGMGGHAAGEVASRLAIESLLATVRAEAEHGPPGDPEEAARRLEQALHEGNRKIYQSVLERGEWRGMGTTIVVLLALGEHAVIAHVGDSRAYRLRNGTLSRLTDDHSWVGEQVRAGLLDESAAHRHPMRNIVTRALGNRSDVEVDVACERLSPGDTLLLCSDGLNSMLADGEIEAQLRDHADDPEGACRALVAQANARGGEDNITVVIVRSAVDGAPSRG